MGCSLRIHVNSMTLHWAKGQTKKLQTNCSLNINNNSNNSAWDAYREGRKACVHIKGSSVVGDQKELAQTKLEKL